MLWIIFTEEYFVMPISYCKVSHLMVNFYPQALLATPNICDDACFVMSYIYLKACFLMPEKLS